MPIADWFSRPAKLQLFCGSPEQSKRKTNDRETLQWLTRHPSNIFNSYQQCSLQTMPITRQQARILVLSRFPQLFTIQKEAEQFVPDRRSEVESDVSAKPSEAPSGQYPSSKSQVSS